MANNFIKRLQQRVQLDKDSGWIFGVCAGIANYTGLDATFFRVGVLVAGLFFPKIVIATYLLAWLILDDRSVFQERR